MSSKRQASSKRMGFGPWDALCVFLVVALLFLLGITAVLPPLLGLTPYAITSQSMAPTLRRGDLLFVRPATLAEVEEGTIITFRAGESVVTHRVYAVDRQAGTLSTKADSSNRVDRGEVTEEALLGRAAYKVPLIGYVSIWLGKGERAP